MKILIVSQYFHPENFRINELAKYFSLKNNKQIKVDVLTSHPSYPSRDIFDKDIKNNKSFKNFDNIKIMRVPSLDRGKGDIINLFFNYISFFFSLLLIGGYKIRNRKYDYILTFGTTPITVAIVSIFFSKIKKSKCILWVLDLWPEILIDLQIIKLKSFVFLILKKVINWIYKKHDLILSQSASFTRAIKKINNNILFFPSWPENSKESYKSDADLENLFKDKKFHNKYKIIFTGNIGQAQDIYNLLPTIKNLQDQNIAFIFVGAGRMLENIKKEYKKNNIKNIYFLGNFPFEKINFFLENADAFLISLKKGSYLNKTIPGKFSTYLQYYKPIIGLIEGETKYYIENYNLGIVLDYTDHNKNVEKIKELIFNKKNNYASENNSKILISSEFNKHVLFDKLYNYLKINLKHKQNNLYFLENLKDIPYKNNFVLSGLNLAFLGYYGKKTINLYDNLICWPDGLFRKIILKKEIKKIPGRKLFSDLELPEEITEIIIAGNCSEETKNSIKKKFIDRDIYFVPLPYGSPKEIAEKIPQLSNYTLLVLTLPTPKQEVVAEILTKSNRFYKILCLGGALEMAFGKEKIPKFFDKDGIESIYRLRFETYRRIRRLLVTLMFFLYASAKGEIKKLVVKNINDKK